MGSAADERLVSNRERVASETGSWRPFTQCPWVFTSSA